MATAAEQAFMVACVGLETARQIAKASALATYVAAGFAGTALAAFRSAIVLADANYQSQVAIAANSNNVEAGSCIVQPFGGTNAFLQATPGIQGGGE